MLVEMDGIDTKEGVIVLASTNRPDVLDKVLNFYEYFIHLFLQMFCLFLANLSFSVSVCICKLFLFINALL